MVLSIFSFVFGQACNSKDNVEDDNYDPGNDDPGNDEEDDDGNDNDDDDDDSSKEGAYKRILSPPRDYDKRASLGSSVAHSVSLESDRPVSK